MGISGNLPIYLADKKKNGLIAKILVKSPRAML